jgi:CRISPR associated protein, Cas1 family
VQLVINTFGAGLRKQGEQFLVQAGEKKLSVSAHKVQSILVTTAVSLSSDLYANGVVPFPGWLAMKRIPRLSFRHSGEDAPG